MNAPARGFVCLFTACLTLSAQPPQGGRGPSPDVAEGIRLDYEGKGKEAKAAFQKAIAAAAGPAEKLQALLGMAMSYGFDGDCRSMTKYQQMAIDHLNAQQGGQPGSTFAQQGELANEAARVCIDVGDLDTAEQWYRKGRDLALKEPNMSPARKALVEFRMENALGRLAARRGNKALAMKHVGSAGKALDQLKAADAAMHQQQQAFLPYLTGYVALYTGDLKTALADLQKANPEDPFVQCLIGMTHEKMGQKEQAMEWYRKASTVRNRSASAAFARRFTRQKLGGA
jgi:tetratricopeptide (TPR) repeat protein